MNAEQTLTGRVAIVTGAAKGIGAGIARSLAAAGAKVVVNYATAEADAARVVAEIEAAGGTARAVRADVTREADVERLFAESSAAFGPVDILVNNAGVYTFGPIEALGVAEFHRHFDLNVLAPMLTMRAAAKAFPQTGGSIVNVGSNVTAILDAGSSLYAASKCALDGLTVVLSRELAARGIRVNSINPGPTDTEGTRAMGVMTKEMTQRILGAIPLGRIGVPEDVGPVAVFLASDAARWLTGEILLVSGGMR